MTEKSNLVYFAEELNRTIAEIHRFFHSMLKTKADPFIKGEITFPQYIVLELLLGQGKLKMKDIAKALNISLPASTGLINRLVSLRLVKRVADPKDRRIVFIEITDKGQTIAAKVRQARKKIIEKMFTVLSDSERKTYLTIVTKVKNSLYTQNETK